ncbi:MAG: DNA repair protein RecN [Flavobacteriales bacterium]|nr:DNA repair protein RecN [Flavobacteriales bacterium]
MLHSLYIHNYALIDHLQINFEDGFSVITGETGSGKSILLGALGLILGERADLSSIRNKEDKCIVEGTFSVTEKDHKNYFDKYELDFEKETIIRREISASGKSRAFINDTPVGLQQLKELGGALLDIHSQHETLLINDQQFVVDLLDSQLTDTVILSNYSQLFDLYTSERKQLSELKERELQAQNQKDYISFLLKEFEEFDINQFIENDLESEYKLLENAEEIKRKLSVPIELINGDNSHTNIVSNLKQIHQELSSLSSLGSQFTDLTERIKSALIELEDIANECARIDDSIELNEDRLSQLDEAISKLNRLLLKHQLSNVQELKDKFIELKQEISGIDSLSEEIVRLDKLVKEKEIELRLIAIELSNLRKSTALKLQSEAKDLLVQMNMKNAEIEFRFEKSEKLGRNGLDNIQLYVKTNLGGTFEPLKRIASGGETSRIMLAIKSLQSESKSLPTIIFDEIDTGVSGEIANKMGAIMQSLGSKMQVISITHLPQIAAKGSYHYKVFKTESDHQTSTKIISLSNEEREREIATMLSGADLTSAALKNAQELLKAK